MPATSSHARPLRTALLVDATASGAMGVLLLAASAPLETMLGLPSALLLAAGAILVPFAALLVWLARNAGSASRGAARGWLRVVIAGNALWAVDSVLLLLTGWVAPNALGVAFVLAQAGAVAVFTWMEAAALRRMGASAAPAVA